MLQNLNVVAGGLSLRLELPLLMLAAAASAQAVPFVYINSTVCAVTCTTDERLGSNPATSYAGLTHSGGPTGGVPGGYNYGAEAAAGAAFNSFSLFAQAAGQTVGPPSPFPPTNGTQGLAKVQYHDEITVAGTGPGTFVVPWHITGSFNFGHFGTFFASHNPHAFFGVPFCQSIRTGFNTGGFGCTGGVYEDFLAPTPYDRIFTLVYKIELGVPYSLNTIFMLDARSGVGQDVLAFADFSHTGLMQPASVYSSGILIPNPVITAASGVNYLDPQPSAAAVPEPASVGMFGAGVVVLAWFRRRTHKPSPLPAARFTNTAPAGWARTRSARRSTDFADRTT